MQARYDIAIVGAGITGCAIARQLSHFDKTICLVEAGDDIALGATKANGGLIHAGYDPSPGTMKARMNARGCELYGQWSDALGFSFHRTGSLVLGFCDEDRTELERLRENGIANGVPHLELVGPKRIGELEPRANPNAICALWCPSTGYVDPFEVAIAAAENAVANGVVFMRGAPVTAIERPEGGGFALSTPKGTVHCSTLINAAGSGAGEISRMAGDRDLRMAWRQGNIAVLDKEPRALMPLYPVPTAMSKGVIVTGTVHGNTVITATAEMRARGDKDTYAVDVETLLSGARKLVPDLDTRRVVRTFAGGRAVLEGTNDFLIEASESIPGLFHAAGIQSPGVASAPAVAERMEQLLRKAGIELAERADWDPVRRMPDDFDLSSLERKEELIESNPAWGRIVCRCETVPEAEIAAAIHREPGAVSVEGVKRRCRAGMGRCQSGFCQSRVVEILARELGIDPSEVPLEDEGSWIVDGPLKNPGAPRAPSLRRAANMNQIETRDYDVVVIGGGPAGMGAALASHEAGASTIVIERNEHLGGILRQCIHPGFGLTHFKAELTGPEYAQRFINRVREADIDIMLGSMALGIDEDGLEGAKHNVTVMSEDGMVRLTCRSVVLAMGCRERTRSEIKIPGSRPAGVYTAGLAQRYINIENLRPGHRVVILGSGDIGLIMARRCALEGLEVEGVYELMPYANGLHRNVKNCLEDFGIPLHLSTTVTRVIGRDRVEAVEVSHVGEDLSPIQGTERVIPCDTLLLSVGLIPENELARSAGVEIDPCTRGARVDQDLQTSVEGIFSCGNVLHVHDLADNVTAEATRAGAAAAAHALGAEEPDGLSAPITLEPGGMAGYIIPARIGRTATTKAFFRVRRPIAHARLVISAGDAVLFRGKTRDYKPSIMETAPITAKMLATVCPGSTLTISIDPAEEA